MASTSTRNLRGLILSASELRRITDWPEELVEDYLNILDNLIKIAENLDTKSGIIESSTLVNTTPYTPTTEDQNIFVDTDGGDIDITLPPGINGTRYRIINVGFSDNRVNLIPALTDKLFGDTDTEYLLDAEVVIMVFESVEGWY